MNRSTEEIRFPQFQNASEDNQSGTTQSVPSSTSQDDREHIGRNSWRFFQDEDFHHPPIPPAKEKQPSTHENQQDFAHEDCFYSDLDTMKAQIIILTRNSYKGELKAAFQDFQKIKGEFLKVLSQFGKDAADLCLRAGVICYRAHVDVEALEWLNKAREFSEKIKEKKRPEHFRKLYLCLADVSIKREKWEDAKKYLKKAEKIIKDYFEDDVSYEGRRTLSWVQALRGHLLLKAEDYEEAEKEYIRQLELKQTLDNKRLEALAYDYLADFYIRLGQKEKAKLELEKSLEASRRFIYGYYTEARYWRNKARIAFEEGDVEGSKEMYHKAFEILERELPDGNAFEGQYQDEYKERFGVEYKGEEDGKVESWLATNSI